MSLVTTLEDAEAREEISKCRVGDLHKSCCENSNIEVYDLDAFAHSLHLSQLPPTCDGVWAGEFNDMERLFLIEMKSISNMRIEFHHSRASRNVRGATPEETVVNGAMEFRNFVASKLQRMNFTGKFAESNTLLARLYSDLMDAIDNETIKEKAFLLCDLSPSEFRSFRHIINSALRVVASNHWGRPQAVTCRHMTEESDLEILM